MDGKEGMEGEKEGREEKKGGEEGQTDRPQLSTEQRKMPFPCTLFTQGLIPGIEYIPPDLARGQSTTQTLAPNKRKKRWARER